MTFMNLTFPGGVHVPYYKSGSKDKAIRKTRLPQRVVIPLSQHTGAPCEPLVEKGQVVKVGQKIGDSSAFVSAPIHASISGKVASIEPLQHPALGKKVMSVVIESDGGDEVAETIAPKPDPFAMDPEEVKSVIREAGIVGLGGAAFPTSVKISPPKDKKIDSYILNGAECEPYLTSDHRLMVERPREAIFGLKVLMYATGVKRGYVCIEDNKPEAIDAMKKAIGSDSNIKLVVLESKYPQGSEKHLIKAVLGREVPSGGLPFDVGAMVSNVGTAIAVADAFITGMPLVQRVITVTGSAIANPANLEVRIGTLFSDIIEEVGGFSSPPGKVIMGGPMMGIAQWSLDVPVIKGTSGILVMAQNEIDMVGPFPCVRCARCVDVCPMNLLPLFLGAYAERGLYADAEAYRALDCIECGSCAYVCPARRPLVQAIRTAKSEIMAKRRAKAQSAVAAKA
ncbi:MAG TPA: electron transport complex subunit RsxC [Clostridia bacterium]|nr:electron transport complex subunit RsxC [Clostridia bacterium]